MVTRYAANHHRLLSRAQTDRFIAALDYARTAQDVKSRRAGYQFTAHSRFAGCAP